MQFCIISKIFVNNHSILYYYDLFSIHVCLFSYEPRLDLQAAREVIMNNPEYSQWDPDKILALCVYKIEEKCHFSGEAVLEPEKYAESVKYGLSQGESKETKSIDEQIF